MHFNNTLRKKRKSRRINSNQGSFQKSEYCLDATYWIVELKPESHESIKEKR